jgi:hypothetical protein
LTKSRLTVSEIPNEDDQYLINRVEGGRGSLPLELPGMERTLFVQHLVRVVEDGDGGGRCNTLSYRYRLQADSERKSTLIRWEYDREPLREVYPYPPAHVHFHGDLGGSAARDLHVPTGRIPLEMVLWHLIADWGVPPLIENWQETLEGSIEGFRERFSAH